MTLREKLQSEAERAASKVNYGTIDVAMRSGKTLIGLRIASKYKKVLVSYPKIPIKKSWDADAIKFNFDVRNITYTTHRSIEKHDLSLYDCVIIDEVHEFSESNIEYAIDNMPTRMYCLTGTLPTEGVKKDFITNYCPVIYQVKIEETVGLLQKDFEVIIHPISPSLKRDIPLKSGKFWSEEAKIRFWHNKYKQSRNFQDMLRLIQSIQNSTSKFTYLKKLVSETERCLVFLETVKQCEELGIPSYHSNEKQSEKNYEDFESGKINKLACIRQLSAGLTFENLNEVIILHCYASSSSAMQRLGRCLNFKEGEKATIHVLCLHSTIDLDWVRKGLQGIDSKRIIYK